MTARIETNFISVGANRSSSCSACSSSGLLAYGAGQMIALWNADPSSSRGVYALLPGHTAVVTVVKLLRDDDGRTGGTAAFVSGDAGGNVRVWRQGADGQYQCTLSIIAHPQASISALAVCPPSGPLAGCIFTGASDGLVKVWRLRAEAADLLQTVDPKGKLPLDMEVSSLPGSSAPVLVLGCTDRRIQIFTLKSSSLRHAFSLEGHEDWVRCLAITPYPTSSPSTNDDEVADLLVASGSQDNYIRLWRISRMAGIAQKPVEHGDKRESIETAKKLRPNGSGQGESALDMLDEFERKLAGEAGGNVQISTKAHVLAVEQGDVGSQRFTVTLEALLVGHENGITNVRWSLPTAANPYPHLLSTGSDNSLIIWTPSSPPGSGSSSDGIWIPAHRFGAIGGRGLSFFGATWGPMGDSVLASGWNGGWERWVRRTDKVLGEVWEPRAGLTGHWEEVKSVEWSPDGKYLLSVSSDQTSRIYAPTRKSSSTSTTASSSVRWTEIARPQIHGYDLTCAAWLSPYRFASGADEKVTRVFDAPAGFVESLASLGVDMERAANVMDRPKGATVPPLGLSNRALGRAVDATMIPTSHHAQDSVSRAMTTLPTEEELAMSTLWPEIEKVYGHGYELMAMAASHDGTLLATACRATTLEHASVRVVSTSSWDTLGVLQGHTLTVTRIQFSADDRYILTCSRDRGWRVFGQIAETDTEEGGWGLVAGEEKAHARMILDACWLPGETGGFATASRDKTAKIMLPARTGDSDLDAEWTVAATIKIDEGISAIDIVAADEQIILALGTESGNIRLYSLDLGGTTVKADLLHTFARSHARAVTRLAFRPAATAAPTDSEDLCKTLVLASCSEDCSLQIFEIALS